MHARDMALYTVRVTFMQEHRQWVAHDESEHRGWSERTEEYNILARSHYEDEGHAAIHEWVRQMFRNHTKKLKGGNLYRLEIMPTKTHIHALVEFTSS